MIYRVYNHNFTLVGEFKTKKEAEKEAKFYRDMTGNPAFVEKETQ